MYRYFGIDHDGDFWFDSYKTAAGDGLFGHIVRLDYNGEIDVFSIVYDKDILIHITELLE